jgi:hypothetical protein
LRIALCFITLLQNGESAFLDARIGMKFDSVVEAWNFWVAYGGIAAFDSRKQYNNKRKTYEGPTSSMFVCEKAGFREKDLRDHLTKHRRAGTRTCCKV